MVIGGHVHVGIKVNNSVRGIRVESQEGNLRLEIRRSSGKLKPWTNEESTKVSLRDRV